ncbi:MAG TPA: MarR family winged helix-turn-helix transcriptional regulator [Trueperaceae bacterium]|nr:MarR family winged helix-turn-helix transcriptional regulator [Trueperaceae bacterium]
MIPTTDARIAARPDASAIAEHADVTTRMRAFLLSYYRAGRAIQEAIDPLITRDYGIDMRDYVVLIAIANGTSYPTDLAAKLHLGKHTITRVLRNLTDAGFVEGIADENDARRIRMTVSAAGRRAKAAMVESITALMAPALTSFGLGRIEYMSQALTELAESVVAGGLPPTNDESSRDQAGSPGGEPGGEPVAGEEV